MSVPKRFITIYDTTLRDGQQGEYTTTLSGLAHIARLISAIGIRHIEGGWSGAVRASTELLKQLSSGDLDVSAQVYSFCRTCKRSEEAGQDSLLQQAIRAAKNVCLFGKNSKRHAISAAGDTDENLRMIRDSVKAAVKAGRRVIYDAEHFFDGYKEEPEYALQCLGVALDAGASWLVLCDTNGGALPSEVQTAVNSVKQRYPAAHLGIHAHNDRGLAVANSLAAVEAGCDMVQGTINGCGERCGNADLVSLIPTLMHTGYDVGISEGQLGQLAHVSREVARIMGMPLNPQQPFVGKGAFTHTGGAHVADLENYRHANPEEFGNKERVRISAQAGSCSIVHALNEAGLKTTKDDPIIARMLHRVEDMEEQGLSFRDAHESFILMARTMLYPDSDPSFKICGVSFNSSINLSDSTGEEVTTIALTMDMQGRKLAATSEGDMPEAINNAMYEILLQEFPSVEGLQTSVDDTPLYGSQKKRAVATMFDPRNGDEWKTMAVAGSSTTATVLALCEAYRYHIEHRFNSQAGIFYAPAAEGKRKLICHPIGISARKARSPVFPIVT